jgi:uncharacterized protein involved in exopolysaccharide biosynthesis
MGEELTIIRKPVPTNSPTMRDLIGVIFRQKRLFILSFVVTFLAVLGYGVFAPSYQTHMSVLVRRGRVDPLVTPAPTPSPMFQRDEITEEELNSQVELLPQPSRPAIGIAPHSFLTPAHFYAAGA